MNYPWDEEIVPADNARRRLAAFGWIVALATGVMAGGLGLAYAGLQPDRKATAQPVARTMPPLAVGRVAAFNPMLDELALEELVDTPAPQPACVCAE